MNKLKVGKPTKAFVLIFEWVFEVAWFPDGGVFCTEQPIPEAKLNLKKITGTATACGNFDEEKHEYKQLKKSFNHP